MANKRGSRKRTRKRKRKKEQAEQPPLRQPRTVTRQMPDEGNAESRRHYSWLRIPFWHLPRWFWAIVVAAATAITLIGAAPYIDLQKDEALSPTDPYRTMFVARNGGWIPINDVMVVCTVNSSGDRFEISDFNEGHRVSGSFGHDDKFTLPCNRTIEQVPNPKGGFMVLPYGSSFKQAELKISISYTTFQFVHRTQSFTLTGEPADDGTLHWSYSGTGR